jgi:ABC-type multidrug transport system ATPase subunit
MFFRGAVHMGVVTQNNSLWDRLSVEAHLYLFARLRGVSETIVDQVVKDTIVQLELYEHRHKLAMRLSGGMKRKLCVAIALIGDPDVVLLDEPSAGLDPVSRRNLWSVILRTMSQRAVVLTTHSMEEAEALCRRIGIMVKGQLRCLGTKQHLKNKFGSGFELTIKLKMQAQGDKTTGAAIGFSFDDLLANLTNFIQSLFSEATLLARNGGLITYQIPKHQMKLGTAFQALETRKDELSIEDYIIAQPTLEQVFIRTVNQYADPKDKELLQAANTPMVLGGSVKIGMEGTTLLEDQVGEAEDVTEGNPLRESLRRLNTLTGNADAGLFAAEKNKCGCTNQCVRIMAIAAAVCTVAFIGGGVGEGAQGKYGTSGFLWTLGLISLIVSCIGCNILYCACCQYPKDVE